MYIVIIIIYSLSTVANNYVSLTVPVDSASGAKMNFVHRAAFFTE